MKSSIPCLAVTIFLAIALAVRAAEPATPGPSGGDKASSATPGPKNNEFARTFKDWKALLADMTNLKVRYRGAEEAQRPAIAEEWKSLVEKATAMLDKLISAAKDAYAEAPGADPKVTDLLLGMVGDWDQRDDYEKALDLARFLIDHGSKDKQLRETAGIAAFALGDFPAAEAYLREAAAAGKPGETAQSDLSKIDYYKEAWEKEKKIREAEAKADDLPRVLLKTSRGDVEIELFENEAPNTVANFLSLVEKGFYNGLTFHRVLPGFMAQGGDPKGDGTGGPGYQIPAEFTRGDHRLHFRGSVAMARSEPPDSAGSQFFLMFVPNKDLDGKYTVFGRMIKGFDVLAKIKRINPDEPHGETPDKILEAKIVRKRPHEYTVKKSG
ncbi:MAG: peptidylprolyl isomerase [Thermoguttaceae bacterium]|jgi:cyclophilin family peptidyl-prolyl cis-trans isomerase